MEREYLSDEELNKLIADVESKPLDRAPEYLETMILQKAAHGSRRKTSPKMRLLTYSIKIMAAAAASIAILFGVPDMSREDALARMQARQMEERERMEEKQIEAMERVERRWERNGQERPEWWRPDTWRIEMGQWNTNTDEAESFAGKFSEHLNDIVIFFDKEDEQK